MLESQWRYTAWSVLTLAGPLEKAVGLMDVAITLDHCHPNLYSLRFSGVAVVLVSVPVSSVCYYALLVLEFVLRQWHEGA
jgi:hypothetical protein